MSRKLVISTFLLLSVATVANLCIAWLCISFCPLPSSTDPQSTQLAPQIIFDLANRSGSTESIAHTYHRHGLGWSRTEARSNNYLLFIYLWRAGWPLPALVGHRTLAVSSQSSNPRDPLGRTESDTGFLITGWNRGHEAVVLPLCPLWPGFVFNTLFYATTVALVGACILALRRAIRIRHGRCPYCAFPIRSHSPACSECGRQFPHRSVA